MSRFAVFAAAVVAALLLPSAALAHVVRSAPVATDFEARIHTGSIEGGRIEARVVDGDRQLWLRVRKDLTVLVPGEEGEPLLRFDGRGVFVNLHSPTALSDGIDRSNLAPRIDTNTPAAWRRVSDAHSYRWHEHRLHALEPLAGGRSTPAVLGRWSMPVAIDGRRVVLAGDLVYRPAGPLWPWAVLAIALAAGIWLSLAVSRSPANRLTLCAAVTVTMLVWLMRVARDLYGRPTVEAGAYLHIGLTSAVGVLLVYGLLHRNSDVRVVTLLLVGLAGLWQSLTSFAVLTHSTAFTVLPTPAVRAAVAAAFGLGAGLCAVVLREMPVQAPRSAVRDGPVERGRVPRPSR